MFLLLFDFAKLDDLLGFKIKDCQDKLEFIHILDTLLTLYIINFIHAIYYAFI